ncbi:hypothetical protein ACFLR1_06105 [Bacteroidota bacterium]
MSRFNSKLFGLLGILLAVSTQVLAQAPPPVTPPPPIPIDGLMWALVAGSAVYGSKYIRNKNKQS